MTLENYDQHTCTDRSHSHLSKTQIDGLQAVGALEWLRGTYEGKSKKERSKEKAVVKIRRFFAARGLSCSIGDGVVEMLDAEERRSIGNVMLSHIKMRSEEQRPQCTDY